MTSYDRNNAICQSCGKPISKPEDFGENADGSKNSDYCGFCFKDGNFSNPNITQEYMIEISAILMASMMNISEKEAKEKTSAIIPGLKRWKN